MDPTQEERTVQELSEAFIALIGDGRSDTGVRALVFTALRYILGGAETPAQAEELLFDTFSVMTVLYTEMLSARFPSDDASQRKRRERLLHVLTLMYPEASAHIDRFRHACDDLQDKMVADGLIKS